jgi:lipid II:glycine glycyltransferase (peptidoglycan interpeptide bridge formation enzyme)
MYYLDEVTVEENYLPLEIYERTMFTQAWFYGQWQSYKSEVRRFVFREDNEVLSYFQVISHPLPANRSYLYIPFGPVFKQAPSKQQQNFIGKKLKEFYVTNSKRKVVFSRLDVDGNFSMKSSSGGWHDVPKFVTSEASFRPRGEMVVPLSTDDEVFARFDKNTRYSVRYGAKKDVEVSIQPNIKDGLDDFFRLLKFTAQKQGFAIFKKDYYLNLFDVSDELKHAYLVEARKDSKVISSKLIVSYGPIAHSLLSGTDEDGRKFRVPSFVQWESMREAMRRGLKYYSIGGASSSDNDYPTIKKVTKYKQGFGGEIKVHNPMLDIVFDKPAYSAFNLYKRLRR